jgi:hypothetical protein
MAATSSAPGARRRAAERILAEAEAMTTLTAEAEAAKEAAVVWLPLIRDGRDFARLERGELRTIRGNTASVTVRGEPDFGPDPGCRA